MRLTGPSGSVSFSLRSYNLLVQVRNDAIEADNEVIVKGGFESMTGTIVP